MKLTFVFVTMFDLKIISLWSCDIVGVKDRSVANVQQNYALRKALYEVLSLCGVWC